MASIAANFVGQGKKVFIIGIGRCFRFARPFLFWNYLDHVKELKNQVSDTRKTPSKPFFFLKPTTSYITRGQRIEIPPGIDFELGVIIGHKCRSVIAQDAMKHVAGYTVAIDLTARNLQEDIKRKQLPWSSVKGFDTSCDAPQSFCPVGNFIQAKDIVDPHQLSIWLKLNGQLKQHSSFTFLSPPFFFSFGSTQNMIYKIPELISYCSGIMTLEEGDLILTGSSSSFLLLDENIRNKYYVKERKSKSTPAGVSSISPGDEVEIGLEQKLQVEYSQSQILDQIKFTAIQRPDGLTYDQLKV
ncbi:uncharacterized protein VP01_463g6 [Puccinia sorghi]|uniref:Fumarylacetoacetase-like C-terminal domain-containing protein n=1 Tax=Puccinia sorghi TaxID=27349 RepID=A0A0L6UNA4_9BASI|nr:uncharacterized protein VP01_463g6 [Puccinia sorghi]